MAPVAWDGGVESQRQVDLLKQQGNAFYRKEHLSAAIDAYTGVSPTDSPLSTARIIAFTCCALVIRSNYMCVLSVTMFNRCAVESGVSY